MASEQSPQRLLPLEGTANFRDLGGYRTSDGATVAWQKVFRADSLAELTPRDHETWRALNIRTVIDLRVDTERKRAPDNLPEDHDHDVLALGFVPTGTRKMLADIRARKLTDCAAINAEVTNHYRLFPIDHAGVYRTILEQLVRPAGLPLVVHCTSGKDRTGFAAAIILLALGVDLDTVMEDYLLTNTYRREISHLLDLDIADDVMKTLTSAQPDYLMASIGSMRKEGGSIDGYMRHVMGIDPAFQARLRAALLV